MSAFRYMGPHSAITLKVAEGSGALRDLDVMLWSGQEVELPAQHEVVVSMVQGGLLQPLEVVPAGAASVSGTDTTATTATK